MKPNGSIEASFAVSWCVGSRYSIGWYEPTIAAPSHSAYRNKLCPHKALQRLPAISKYYHDKNPPEYYAIEVEPRTLCFMIAAFWVIPGRIRSRITMALAVWLFVDKETYPTVSPWPEWRRSCDVGVRSLNFFRFSSLFALTITHIHSPFSRLFALLELSACSPKSFSGLYGFCFTTKWSYVSGVCVFQMAPNTAVTLMK